MPQIVLTQLRKCLCPYQSPVGCGKTTLLKVASFLPNQLIRPFFKSCREISHEVAADGPATLLHFTKHSFDYINGKPRTWLFDDLGVETNVNYFGTALMPMADILLARYDYFLSQHENNNNYQFKQ